jgi:hypothetical protein
MLSLSIPSLSNGFQTAFFDVPLHDNFYHASRRRYDLRRILDNTLLKARPNDAVTFVDNHESVGTPLAPFSYSLALGQHGNPHVSKPGNEG